MDTQTGLTLFNATATAGKNLYEIAQGTSKMEEKRQLMAVYEILMNLKRDAGDLEDTVRELKEKLRFKSGAFEFKNPFWFDHRFPDRALCPKCFSHEVVAPVSERFGEAGGVWRKCSSCDTVIEENKGQRVYNTADYGGGGGRWS